jgi:hypothetical protein
MGGILIVSHCKHVTYRTKPEIVKEPDKKQFFRENCHFPRLERLNDAMGRAMSLNHSLNPCQQTSCD